MAKDIPIQNVYYLLCYAWEQMREGEVVDVGEAGRTDLTDLFAQVLAEGTKRILRQGLDRGYVSHREDTSRIRGRIDFSTSLKRALFPRAQAHCQYDELSRNVLHNQILRSTIRLLIRVEDLDGDLKNTLRGLDRRLSGIDTVPLNGLVFRQVQLHAGNAFYRFLMNVCDLIQRNTFAQDKGEGQRFRDFLQDEATMWKLFEEFVYNFYRHEQSRFEVSRPEIAWDLDEPKPADGVSTEGNVRLPTMKTDVVLQSGDQKIIIDTKFYTDTLQSNHGNQSYHSANLYQLFTYLKNAEARGDTYMDAEGILLYPTVSYPLDDQVWIQGHKIRVRTLNLAQKWKAIEQDLKALIGLHDT